MNKETKTESKLEKISKELLYNAEYPADKSEQLLEEAQAFCEGYKTFLDNGKTEREVTDTSEEMLVKAGYTLYDTKKTYKAGDKIYFIQAAKSIVAATIGQKSMEEGFHLNISHGDAPRLDLKPNPLYEKCHMSLLKTHYYGGVRKYQWVAIPLALHGVFCKANGEVVKVSVGEDAGDPVFCISDLLPHLAREQRERKLPDGIRGEELNVIIGSTAVTEEEVKNSVKLKTMMLLNEKYGIVERDFQRAEIEVVPAGNARDVGFDRAIVGAYGQDDRVCAYPSLLAEINCKTPTFTTICVITDKEEVGSDGITGMQSTYVFDFMRRLCKMSGADEITAFHNSKCLSSDVTAAHDPTFESAFEPLNSTYFGRGIAFAKYTGSGGKGGASDAPAELVAYVADMCEENDISWQIGEMGRVDLGGGGTIAKFVAKQGIPTIDVGVPVLAMHSPFELTHKIDIYMGYKTYLAFNEATK